MFKELVKKDLLIYLKDLKFQIFMFWTIAFMLVSCLIGLRNLNVENESINTESNIYRNYIDPLAQNMQKLIPEEIRMYYQPGIEKIFLASNEAHRGMATSVVTFNPSYTMGATDEFSLDFIFIIGLIGSFIALLFSYNAMSDEKERGTFRLQLVSGAGRLTILLSKFLALLLLFASVFMLAFTFVLLFYWLMTGNLTGEFLTQLLFFYICSMLYIAFFLLGGILISLFKNNRSAIIAALSFWLLFTIIIPKTVMIFAEKTVPLKSQAEIEQLQDEALRNEFDTWQSNYCNVVNQKTNLPEDQLWSNDFYKNGLRVKAMNSASQKAAQKKIELLKTDARQYETYDQLASISPYYLFKKINETMLDLGYFRFNRAYRQLENRRTVVENALKSADLADKTSLHFFYGRAQKDKEIVAAEGLTPFSQKPFLQKYLMIVYYQKAPLLERITALLPCLGILLGLNLLVLLICSYKTIRYDVR